MDPLVLGFIGLIGVTSILSFFILKNPIAPTIGVVSGYVLMTYAPAAGQDGLFWIGAVYCLVSVLEFLVFGIMVLGDIR